MVTPRRAAMRGASPSLVAGVRAALARSASALAGVLAALGFVSVRMARRVVTPATRVADTRILALDTAAQTITLSRTARHRAARPLRPVHERHGELRQARLRALRGRRRPSSASCSPTSAPHAQLSPDAAFSGWYYDHARRAAPALHPRAHRLAPSVRAPPGSSRREPSDVWVIQVHGRGTTRAECLRAVPVFHALGHHVARRLVPQRRRGAAQPHRHLRARRDRVARRRRRRRVRPPPRGASASCSWAGRWAARSRCRSRSTPRTATLIAGLILESPVIDWRIVLDYQARLLGLPTAVQRPRDRRAPVGVGDADHPHRGRHPVRPARRGRARGRAAASDPHPAQRRRRLRAVGCLARPRRRAPRPRRDEGLRGRAPHQAVELRPGALERQHPLLARAPRLTAARAAAGS